MVGCPLHALENRTQKRKTDTEITCAKRFRFQIKRTICISIGSIIHLTGKTGNAFLRIAYSNKITHGAVYELAFALTLLMQRTSAWSEKPKENLSLLYGMEF